MERKEAVGKMMTSSVGNIKMNDSRGYTYLPRMLRDELGLDKVKAGDQVPFFLDAYCVLLVRKDATPEDVLKGLDILKQDLKLRVRRKAPKR